MTKRLFLFFCSILLIVTVFAQETTLKGKVTDKTNTPLRLATISIQNTSLRTITNEKGTYQLGNIPAGNYFIKVNAPGFEPLSKEISIKGNESKELNFVLSEDLHLLNEVVINGVVSISGMGHLTDVHDGVIYSGKKNEVLILDSLDANTAQNNPRQVMGRIPGANYSETQGSGFPSNGIGFRGLNPTQSIETNTRQNGYNVAADIYGYSEAYYLSPLEAVERVEVTRGESSLQFGPQFGGVINYIIKDGNKDKPLEYTTEQTGGSFGFFNSFHSFGGQLGKLNYYSFIQYQSIQGWRPNSDYRQITGYGKLSYDVNPDLKLSLEYTLLRNRIHMPGGFDDAQFSKNSDTSYRSRNWLESPWNIIAAKAAYKISPKTSLNLTSSYLFSARNLVWKNEDGGPGVLDTINPVTQQYVNREVQREKMNSLTTELRLLHDYSFLNMNNTVAAGVRYFVGDFKRQGGGLGTSGSDFNLTLLDPHYGYNLDFTTTNIAPFVENIFRITDKFSVTPGFRCEYINSTINGYITADTTQVNSRHSKNRYIPLLGIGSQYKISSTTNIYANISQAYSPVTYDQLTPFATNSRIDPNMRDANGYNSDLGWRGRLGNFFNFDLGVFYLVYNNRIGIVELTDANGNPYTYRTNVANSEHKGLETYIEFCPTKMLHSPASFGNISFFNSFSYIDARYTTGQYKGNFVEYAPQTIERFGLTYARKGFSTTFLISNTARSYGDANNIVSSADPIVGIIPAYTVIDWSASCKFKNNYNIKLGVNNLADEKYFTKRTDEYPGPGIIPAIGRSFYFSFGVKF